MNYITPLAVKFELHAYGNAYDVSNCIANWKELEIVLKRDGTSGVFHELSFPFGFVLDAYDVLKGVFDAFQYRATAEIYIYIRRDDWAECVAPAHESTAGCRCYFEPQIFNLDFTAYEETSDKIEIEAKKGSLYDILKSKGKVTYDIPVSEICETKKWNFERIELENKIVFRSQNELPVPRDPWQPGNEYRTIGVSVETTEVGVQDVVFVNTIGMYTKFPASFSNLADYYFVQMSEKAAGRYINLEVDIKGRVRYEPMGSVSDVKISLIKESGQTRETIGVKQIGYNTPALMMVDNEFEWKGKSTPFFNPGDGICLYLSVYTTSTIMQEIFDVEGTISISYNARHNPIEIEMIKPHVLLQRLVDDMTQAKGSYNTDIEDFNTNEQDLIMMSAAESIRGIEATQDSVGAQVHTSYNTFLKWMNAFGREEHVTGNSVIFKIREKSFRADLTAIELEEDECADLKVSVDDGYLYSGVRVGYERKNIENANVRFEFNGIHDYSTDLALNDKVIEFISPYRADCYGIEFLAQERLKTTTDNRADKDLFLVHVKTETEYIENPGGIGTINIFYSTIKSVFSGNVLTNIGSGQNNDTMFNANINPFVLLLANHGLIGVGANEVRFAASDSNSEIVIDNKPINSDWIIPLGVVHFDAIKYDIASKNIQRLPEGDAINGLVRFRYKGKTYEGFIDEISKNPAWDAETTWKLRKRR